MFVLRSLLIFTVLAIGGQALPGLPLSAQEPEEPLTEAEPPSAEEVASSTAKRDGWQTLIYLPFKRFEQVFGNGGAAAFLPYEEYLKLWQSHLERLQEGKLAHPVVLSETAYTIDVTQQQAAIRVEMTIDVLEGTWGTLPLSFGSAAVGAIEPHEENPGRVVLHGTEDGTSRLRLEQPGQYRVTLELAERVRTSPEGKLLELTVPTAGVTRVQFTTDEADQQIDFTPASVVTVRETDDENVTAVTANVGSTEKFTIRWRPRTGTRPDMELLAGVTNYLQVTIDEALVHYQADLVFNVLRGELEQIRLAVPKEHRILDVTADHTVKQWRVDDEETRQLLTIDLLGRAEDAVTVSIHTEQPLPEEPFDVGGQPAEGAVRGIHAVDALRENGQISLRHSDQLELTVEQQSGAMRIEPAEADERIQRPGAQYYRFFSSAFRLQIDAEPIQPRIVVKHIAKGIFRRERLDVESVLNYTVERAGIFDVTLAIPEGLEIDDVTSPALKQFNVTDDELRVTLDSKRLGQFPITVRGHRDLPEVEDEDFPLPLVEPQNVEREEGYVTIYAPDALEVITDRDNVEAARPWTSPAVEPQDDARFVSAWEFRRRPVSIPVRTRLRPTRLGVEIATHVNVQPQLIDVTSHVTYDVEYAGLSTFRFAFPAAVEDRIQVRLSDDGAAPGIKQETTDADPDDEGRRIRTVTLQREALGRVTFVVRYDLPAPADDDSQFEFEVAPIVALPSPSEDVDDDATIPLTKTYGEITVAADRSMSVVGEGNDAVEAIDPRERTLAAAAGTIAYRYYRQPVQVELSVSRHDIQEVVETVVSKSLVEVVIDREGRPTYRCRYVLKSSERQRLRIDFPNGFEPLAAAMNGRTIALEQSDEDVAEGWGTFYANVARSGSADEPFHLAFLFRGPVLGLFETSGGRLRLLFPVLGGVDDANVVVQQSRVAIWMPERYALVGEPEGYSRVGELSFWRGFGRQPSQQNEIEELEQWIGTGTAGVFDFPTIGHVDVYEKLGQATSIEVLWRYTTVYAWVLSGAFVIIGLLLMKTRWENKLTLVVLLAAVAALYALRDADWVLHGLAAASVGLIAMFLLWLVHGMYRASQPAPRPALVTNSPTVPAVIPPPGLFDPSPATKADSNKREGNNAGQE